MVAGVSARTALTEAALGATSRLEVATCGAGEASGMVGGSRTCRATREQAAAAGSGGSSGGGHHQTAPGSAKPCAQAPPSRCKPSAAPPWRQQQEAGVGLGWRRASRTLTLQYPSQALPGPLTTRRPRREAARGCAGRAATIGLACRQQRRGTGPAVSWRRGGRWSERHSAGGASGKVRPRTTQAPLTTRAVCMAVLNK